MENLILPANASRWAGEASGARRMCTAGESGAICARSFGTKSPSGWRPSRYSQAHKPQSAR